MASPPAGGRVSRLFLVSETEDLVPVTRLPSPFPPEQLGLRQNSGQRAMMSFAVPSLKTFHLSQLKQLSHSDSVQCQRWTVSFASSWGHVEGVDLPQTHPLVDPMTGPGFGSAPDRAHLVLLKSGDRKGTK